MDFESILDPPRKSILLRVVPSTATTVGGKLVIPNKGILDFFRNVSLSSTCHKTDAGTRLLKVLDERGNDIVELLEASPGSTAITVASSYGISLLLYDNMDGVIMDDVVKLSHGCLLVLIETKNDPTIFNVDAFVQRLQHITGDTNLALKEPPKLLYQECEGHFVTAPIQDPYACLILQALERVDIGFFTNESQLPHIVTTIKKQSIAWVIWPRIFLYILLDVSNQLKWATVLHKLVPYLPFEERKLVSSLTENMKKKFGDYSPKQDLVGVTAKQMMLIQPLISTIIFGQLLSPIMSLSMCDTLYKRASLAAQKYVENPSLARWLPKLAAQSPHKLVEFTVLSKSLGETEWASHVGGGDQVKVTPQTQINFQIKNHTTHPVCWQVWNFSSNPEEKPSLLLPYSDPTSVANLTLAGEKWTHKEEGDITFEMSEEGVESVTLFAWGATKDGDVHYERTTQQIHVAVN